MHSKLKHNHYFEQAFEKVNPKIQHYPYVGENFGKKGKRVMVFGHNAAVPAIDYEKEVGRTRNKHHFGENIWYFTYEKAWWTKAFRFFVKGAVSLEKNFDKDSNSEIISKVDEFVGQIAFKNFIDGLIKSKTAVNAKPSQSQIRDSQQINKQLLEIMGISHCVCWGKEVFEHLKGIDGISVIEERPIERQGFHYVKAQIKKGQPLHVLRVYHPSMPSFKPYDPSTHEIFNWFFAQK